jgi:hypothetical protein
MFEFGKRWGVKDEGKFFREEENRIEIMTGEQE